MLRFGADPGQQLITVVRKGSRAMQQLPASPDAFVWLRLYQQQTHGLVPDGPDDPLWWTLRRPFRPLNYHAARAMFVRANDLLGSNWSLHDLRHTAAYRLARDPDMPITDVQWVLGHASLTTTQLYTTPTPADVIEAVMNHHRRRAEPQPHGRTSGTAVSPGEPGCAVRPEDVVTTTTVTRTSTRTWQVSTEAKALLETVPAPTRSGELAADPPGPRRRRGPTGRAHRSAPTIRTPAATESCRCRPCWTGWSSIPARPGSNAGTPPAPAATATAIGGSSWSPTSTPAELMHERRDYVRKVLGMGMIQLIGGDYVRPSTGWLMATSSPCADRQRDGRCA